MKPEHLAFAQAYLETINATQAYLSVRPKASRKNAGAMGAKWLARTDVARFLAEAQAEAQRRALDASVLTLLEKRQFLAQIVRTPITSLDPHDPSKPENVLIKSFAINESEMGSSTRLEKLDPLRAIALDNDLAGDGSTTNTLRDLTEALQSLAPPSTLPTGKI